MFLLVHTSVPAASAMLRLEDEPQPLLNLNSNTTGTGSRSHRLCWLCACTGVQVVTHMPTAVIAFQAGDAGYDEALLEVAKTVKQKTEVELGHAELRQFTKVTKEGKSSEVCRPRQASKQQTPVDWKILAACLSAQCVP